VRATAQGCDPQTSTVREVMTRGIICGQETQDITEAAELMRRDRLTRIPVVDTHRHLVGMVSLAELRQLEWPGHGAAKRTRRRAEFGGEN